MTSYITCRPLKKYSYYNMDLQMAFHSFCTRTPDLNICAALPATTLSSTHTLYISATGTQLCCLYNHANTIITFENRFCDFVDRTVAICVQNHLYDEYIIVYRYNNYYCVAINVPILEITCITCNIILIIIIFLEAMILLQRLLTSAQFNNG